MFLQVTIKIQNFLFYRLVVPKEEIIKRAKKTVNI